MHHEVEAGTLDKRHVRVSAEEQERTCGVGWRGARIGMRQQMDAEVWSWMA
jgi:hypothetical protein